MSVKIGTSHRILYGRVIDIKEIIMHPDYTSVSGSGYDVALLKPSTKIVFNSNSIKPVKLIDEGVETANGSIATVAGWGKVVVRYFLYFRKQL